MTDSSGNKKCNVLVTGDVCHDVYIATTHDPQYHNLWRTGHEWASISYAPGCAALLYDLLATINREEDIFNLFAYLPNKTAQERWTQSLNIFKEFRKKPEESDLAWRISGFLGQQSGETIDYCWWPCANDNRNSLEASQTDIAIIDDKNLGFRDNEHEYNHLNPYLDNARWIIYRMARPLCNGTLWEKISNSYFEKLIVVFTISDLRDSGIQIGQSLSWEQLTDDILVQLKYNAKFSSLDNCNKIIISFDDAGAFLRSTKDKFTLFFRPDTLEKLRDARIHGRVTGYTYCLISALTRELSTSSLQAVIEETTKTAILKGINAELHLHLHGYNPNPINSERTLSERNSQYKLFFPFQLVSDQLKKIDINIKNIDLTNQLDSRWSILSNIYNNDEINEPTNISIENLINSIIIRGAESGLKSTTLPYWKISRKLILVNRFEIESLRGIEALVREYIANGGKKGGPLSFAIFGPPGSGKSFTIKQMAEENDWNSESITFNLSQFARAEELCGAFHQIRSINLKGKLPLVFWDEFDTALNNQELGWLRLFLAPMQDGQFIEGQFTHSIGPAIFLFAGGTVETLEAFENNKNKPSSNWKSLKGPDFVSRLTGYLNVRGINISNKECSIESTNTTLPPDNECKVRRAILLRSLLERYAPNIFPATGLNTEVSSIESFIDKGLLKAFMDVKEYRHGARSMESIISGSRLSGQRKYTRSALPPRETLRLHIDDNEFFTLMGDI